MTQSSIPPEIRHCAMWCHLVNLTWIFTTILGVLISTSVPDLTKEPRLAIIALLLFPPLSIVISRIISVVIWRTNRSHPFVDEAGKEAINFSLSIDLYIFVVLAIALASCGLGAQSSYPSTALFSIVGFYIVLIIPFLLLLYLYLIVGGIQAANGRIHKYPKTIQFLK
jgi:uncharacterized Tic20 family protein